MITLHVEFLKYHLNHAVLSARTSFAALTTEFAPQTRRPQSSFALETARCRNLARVQTVLISKLYIPPVQERIGKFPSFIKLEIEPKRYSLSYVRVWQKRFYFCSWALIRSSIAAVSSSSGIWLRSLMI